MISDLVCALIPVFTIWRLSRSVGERTLISVLMASCLLASGCGIAKLYYMIIYNFATDDNYWDTIPEFFWCRMEEAIIIIAACVPLLKAPIERMMKRVGLPTLQMPPPGLNHVVISPASGGGTNESEKELTRVGYSVGRQSTEGGHSDLSLQEDAPNEPDLEQGADGSRTRTST